jgi:hypothetical protein
MLKESINNTKKSPGKQFDRQALKKLSIEVVLFMLKNLGMKKIDFYSVLTFHGAK